MKKAAIAMLKAVELALDHTRNNPALSEAHGTLAEAYHDLAIEMDKQQHEENLFAEMVRHYGESNQMDAMVEELAEVIQARNKVRRDDNAETRAHLSEELVDASLMIAQIIPLLPENVLAGFRSHKLQRMEKRLAKSKIQRAENYKNALIQAGGLRNLFDILCEKGLICVGSDLEDIMHAVKDDLTLTEIQVEAEEVAPEEDLLHDGKAFIPETNYTEGEVVSIYQPGRHGSE